MLEYCPFKYKTLEMCENVLDRHSYMLKFCPDNCKTHKICEKALDKTSLINNLKCSKTLVILTLINLLLNAMDKNIARHVKRR